MLDAVIPPTLTRCAQRISTILITLALLVAFLFPTAAMTGTEVPLDRAVTAGLLGAFGLVLRFLPRLSIPILLVHGGLQAALGAEWAAALSVGLVAYTAISWWRGRGAVETVDGMPEECPLAAADVVYENVEAVVMALLIALTVREFLYEAFLIPTASMQPTILGKEPRLGREHGDRLLATKIPMLLGDPPRWSIVVFKYPLYRRINYIKRLVGLPGELVELIDGDVYVNHKCVAKPESVQDQLWFPEYPSPGQPRPLSASFVPGRDSEGWSVGDASATGTAAAGSETRLSYGDRLDERDSDLRVGADLEVTRLDDGGAILLRVEGARRRVDLEVRADGAVLSGPGLDGFEIPEVHVGAGTRVTLGVADRVARVWLDGRLVARVPHADAENDGARRPNVSVGVRGGEVSFASVRVERDLQYGKSRAWQIPDDSFIMLGDNTDSSKDSREWDVTVVKTPDGRTFRGEQLVKLEDNSSVAFRNDGETCRFIDVDGVYRVLPSEGLEVEHGVRWPFVKRGDLVGRAFLTFFPFPPFGDFRPRFLP